MPLLQNHKTVLNAVRYSGRTTALALRALLESVRKPAREIACLSSHEALMNRVGEPHRHRPR